MAYTISGNMVLRDGETVAVVLPDGSLDTVEGMEKFRTQSVKELAKAGRRKEDGTFVFVESAQPQAPEAPEASAASEAPATPAASAAPADEAPVRPTISTVRELVRAVEAASGDAAPPLSPIYGDETPEVWSYLRRHINEYNALRANYDITIKHNHLEE